MVVAHAVHDVVPLVVAAGDEGHVAHVDAGDVGRAGGVDLRGIPRVFHAARPLGAVGFCADGAEVAAHADEGAGQAPGLSSLRHHLDGIALAHAAHIEGHGGVGEVDRLGLLVDDEVRNITVLCSGIQRFLRGQLVVRLAFGGLGGLTAVVPDTEDAAHGDVQLAVCGVVHLPGQLQHPEDLIVHLNRGSARVVVDGLDVHHAVVVVVDVVETVVFQQVGVEGVHLAVELLLAVAVGDDLRYGVKRVVKDGAVPLGIRAHAGGRRLLR